MVVDEQVLPAVLADPIQQLQVAVVRGMVEGAAQHREDVWLDRTGDADCHAAVW